MSKRALTVVTSSELQTFRDCGAKWGMAYAEGLRPRVAHHVLSFGSAIHVGLAAAIAEETTIEAIVTGQLAAEKKHQEWVASTMKDEAGKPRGLPLDLLDELVAEAEEAVKLAHWMIEHYVRTFADDWRYLVPLGIEKAFTLRATNVRGARVGHLGYAGVWDLIAYDRRYGDIVTMDHKTTTGAVDSIDRRVELDPQIAGYVWALRRALWEADESIGETRLSKTLGALREGGIAGLSSVSMLTADEYERIVNRKVATGRVVYNVLRKKAPSVPKINEDGRVSAAKIDTFAATYEAALYEQETARFLARTPKQEALLAELAGRSDPYLSRREFHRSDEEIERWRRELFVDASRLRDAEEDPTHRTRNPGHCTMPWSMPCSYRRPCLDPTMTDGFVVQPRHVEVETAIAEERES